MEEVMRCWKERNDANELMGELHASLRAVFSMSWCGGAFGGKS